MFISLRCILMTEILQSMQGELNDRRINPIAAPERLPPPSLRI